MINTQTAFRFTSELEQDKVMNSYLKVTNAGFSTLSGIDQTKIWQRPNTNVWLYIYVKRGNMILKTENQTYHMSEGYSCLLPPDLYCTYTFKKEDDNEHYYIFFGGYGTKDVLKELKLDKSTVFYCSKHINFSEKIITIVNNFKINKFKYNIINTSLFLQILSNISIDSNRINLRAQDSTIENAIRKMQDSYMDNLSINDYAKLCNISKSNFIKKFKEVKNTTPQKYLADIKLNIAKELLETTDLSIAEVADNLGFYDAYYFSNFFKKFIGVSPLNYKKSHNKE